MVIDGRLVSKDKTYCIIRQMYTGMYYKAKKRAVSVMRDRWGNEWLRVGFDEAKLVAWANGTSVDGVPNGRIPNGIYHTKCKGGSK